jgi:hypothetical protein
MNMGYNAYMNLGGWRFLKNWNASFIKCDTRELLLTIPKNRFFNILKIYSINDNYIMEFYKDKKLINKFDDVMGDELLTMFVRQIDVRKKVC